MGLVLNKHCFTFLISAQFHFPFYRLSCGISNLRAFFKGCWRLGSVTSITTHHVTGLASVSRHDFLSTETSVAFLFPLLVFLGLTYSKQHLFTSGMQMRIKLTWSDFLTPQSLDEHPPLDFSISFKRKLKSEFIKSPNLNSFYSYSVTRMQQSEESSKQTNKQTNRNKHRTSGFCFCFCP